MEKLVKYAAAFCLMAAALPAPAAPPKSKDTDEAAYPAQESVASKTAHFTAVSASSPAVMHALKCDDLTGGAKLEGKKGAFEGVLVSVYEPKGNNTVYLDFASPWKNALSGAVAHTSFTKFPVLKSLQGKKVLITGTFSLYGKSHPEIVLTSPSQIKLVK